MVDELDAVFKALANLTRRSMLDSLRNGPLTTGELAGRFPSLSRYAVMKHLDVLVGASLVTVRRQGRQRFNYLNPVPIRSVYDRWMTPFAETWTDRALGLKRHVETTREYETTAERSNP